MQQAVRTCELAGGSAALPRSIPTWRSGATALTRDAGPRQFTSIVPAGCCSAMASQEGKRVIAHLRAVPGDVLLLSSAYFLRVLARPLGVNASVGEPEHARLRTRSDRTGGSVVE